MHSGSITLSEKLKSLEKIVGQSVIMGEFLDDQRSHVLLTGLGLKHFWIDAKDENNSLICKFPHPFAQTCMQMRFHSQCITHLCRIQ